MIMKLQKKYLLIATIGVFALSFAACSSDNGSTTANVTSAVDETAVTTIAAESTSITTTVSAQDPPEYTAAETAESPSLEAVLSEVQDQFVQLDFEDAETGKVLSYNLFVPDNYDETQSYPLVLFMHDASVVGKGTDAALTQGYGGVIWATSAEQEKHPSFVLVPAYAESTISDGTAVTDQVDITLRLLAALQTEYNINADRIYTTGQSMGAMTSLYLNATYPELFAASLYVAGQWDAAVLEPLETQKFIYIVAGGDEKASGGMDDLKVLFDADNTAYSEALWDATWTTEQFAAAVSELLAEGNERMMATFETGTVLVDSTQNMEHMASFDHGYTIEGVRDWLFAQSK